VKLTVQISAEHSELRKLVQGSILTCFDLVVMVMQGAGFWILINQHVSGRLDGIPTPPTQEIMETLAASSSLQRM